MTRKLGVLLVVLLAAATAAAQTMTVDVTAPDGTRLATDVYLPLGTGPWPVLLMRTPYNKDGMEATCIAVSLSGAACVVQDTRGRYDSGGEDTVFRDGGPDGRATVDWITEQWWCNGTIAGAGGSALGITQYTLAPGADPAYTCVYPVVATPDLYRHVMLQGGALRESLIVNWLAGQGSLHFLDEVRQHRLWDSWWEEVDPLADVRSVRTAGLHVGGWFDIFQQGTIDGHRAYQHLGGPGAAGEQYLVIGPWTHGTIGQRRVGELTYPLNAVGDEIFERTDRWLAHCLFGSDPLVEAWAPVHVYLMGAVGEEGPGNRWLDLADWPPASREHLLYLAASGSLAGHTPAAGEAVLTINPEDPVPTLGGANLHPDLLVDGRPMGAGPYDQRVIEARDDVLVFTTEPLAEPLTVIGRLSVRLWIRPDTPDLDVAVRLTDVYPDGRSMLVADGIQRARMRCGDDRECFLEPGVPVELEVDLWSTAMVFNAGHRIRISVSGTNHPRFEVNPNDGGPIDTGTPIVATPSVLFGSATPSALVLPVPVTPRSVQGRASAARP